MEESGRVTFLALHCARGCTFGGWHVDPRRLQFELAIRCPYDGTPRTLHRQPPAP
jgi:hypothetical protein